MGWKTARCVTWLREAVSGFMGYHNQSVSNSLHTVKNPFNVRRFMLIEAQNVLQYLAICFVLTGFVVDITAQETIGKMAQQQQSAIQRERGQDAIVQSQIQSVTARQDKFQYDTLLALAAISERTRALETAQEISTWWLRFIGSGIIALVLNNVISRFLPKHEDKKL